MSGERGICSECGQQTQCAACYLMETEGVPTPPRVPSTSEGEGA